MDVDKAMKQAKASIQIDGEGLVVTQEHDILVRSVLTGEITEVEFERRVSLLLKKVDK